MYLHAMHSVVDWFAFAVWGPDGKLRRALSVSPANGVIEASVNRCRLSSLSGPEITRR